MKTTIHTRATVVDPETGVTVWFEIGDDLPKWAADIIRKGNPALLSDPETEDDDKADAARTRKKAANANDD